MYFRWAHTYHHRWITPLLTTYNVWWGLIEELLARFSVPPVINKCSIAFIQCSSITDNVIVVMPLFEIIQTVTNRSIFLKWLSFSEPLFLIDLSIARHGSFRLIVDGACSIEDDAPFNCCKSESLRFPFFKKHATFSFGYFVFLLIGRYLLFLILLMSKSFIISCQYYIEMQQYIPVLKSSKSLDSF